MKKILFLVLAFLTAQNISSANDILQFDFPNAGWHKVASPDGVESKKCYVPVNQTSENYTEMLTFIQKASKNKELPPMVIMQKQLGKDKNNYTDIAPHFINNDMENPMALWCSQYRNTCVIQRAFKGNDGVVLAIYTNKSPHYSQNIFGQWSNILSQISVYTPSNSAVKPSNLIEL